MPTYLGEFEHLVLLAVLRLGDQAYAVPIRRLLEEHTVRQVGRGALYTTLERLEQKRLLRSDLGDPIAERGGRPRRYYSVTAQGLGSLRAARGALDRLSHGLDVELGVAGPTPRGRP